MSVPQHWGDLILPSQDGHWDICTSLPSSRANMPFSSGSSHLAQVALTDIPQDLHSYVDIVGVFNYFKFTKIYETNTIELLNLKFNW
jgi:hypothetical protein